MITIQILMLALLIFVNYYLAKQFCEVAQMKGYPDKKYFWIPFLLSIPGYLLIIALPDKNSVGAVRNEYSNNELPTL